MKLAFGNPKPPFFWLRTQLERPLNNTPAQLQKTELAYQQDPWIIVQPRKKARCTTGTSLVGTRIIGTLVLGLLGFRRSAKIETSGFYSVKLISNCMWSVQRAYHTDQFPSGVPHG